VVCSRAGHGARICDGSVSFEATKDDEDEARDTARSAGPVNSESLGLNSALGSTSSSGTGTGGGAPRRCDAAREPRGVATAGKFAGASRRDARGSGAARRTCSSGMLTASPEGPMPRTGRDASSAASSSGSDGGSRQDSGSDNAVAGAGPKPDKGAGAGAELSSSAGGIAGASRLPTDSREDGSACAADGGGAAVDASSGVRRSATDVCATIGAVSGAAAETMGACEEGAPVEVCAATGGTGALQVAAGRRGRDGGGGSSFAEGTTADGASRSVRCGDDARCGAFRAGGERCGEDERASAAQAAISFSRASFSRSARFICATASATASRKFSP
jgi:hypothetical protein